METITTFKSSALYYAYITILMFMIAFAFPQANCNVSPISGPTTISGSGTITKLYTVSSNGQHIWTLPNNVCLVSYGANGNDSITISFAPNFTSGTISVRRNGPSCTNIIQTIQVVRNSCNMSVNVGNDTKVYFGYAPMACSNIAATVSNGTAPYTYAWSNGARSSSINVCPSTSTTYEVIVTDASGCRAKDALNVCVVDVRCNAGKSNILKVEVCHKNKKTLCVNASAVPAHLANGVSLGSCAEQNNCATNTIPNLSNQKLNTSEEEGIEFYKKELSVYPILTSNLINIELEIDVNNAAYEIININGQAIAKGVLTESKSQLDVSSYASGLYYVKLVNTNIEAEKFIKE